MTKTYQIGIVGAGGMVGTELIKQLERRDFPARSLTLFSGFVTAGEAVEFQGEELTLEPIRADYYQGLDLVFFAAHPWVSRDLVEDAAKAGVWVIDASRQFRLNPQVPLLVPEVNADALSKLKPKSGGKIISSPGPAAVALSLALFAVENQAGVKQAVATVLYGSSYGGRAGLEELQEQTIAIFNNQDFDPVKFPRQAAFNIFPQVGRFLNRDTEEENDIAEELKKILGLPELGIGLTCVQAPVFAGISISLFLQTRKPVSERALRDFLSRRPGIQVMDDPAQDQYPDLLAVMEQEPVLAGRIREVAGSGNGFQIWIVIDNTRKGSSLNLVQIAEKLIELGLI